MLWQKIDPFLRRIWRSGLHEKCLLASLVQPYEFLEYEVKEKKENMLENERLARVLVEKLG